LATQLSRSTPGKKFLEVDGFRTESWRGISDWWSNSWGSWGMLLSSLRQIAKRILIPMSTIRYHLVNSLRHRISNIRWVPRPLSSNQKQARVEMSQDLLQVLRLAKHHAWKYIVTLDEARFYFWNHVDRIWLSHDELPPSCRSRRLQVRN
jgi:hypothetical protein